MPEALISLNQELAAAKTQGFLFFLSLGFDADFMIRAGIVIPRWFNHMQFWWSLFF